MAKKTVQKEIYRFPGPQQLQSFLKAHSKLFNYSELERMCEFSSGTLRHFCAGTREMKNAEYVKLQEIVLPKLCEVVLLLQYYGVNQ